MSPNVFGHDFARALNIRQALTFAATDTSERVGLEVTLVRRDVADHLMTAPIVRDDALLLMVQMRDWPTRILWRDGKRMPATPLKAGDLSIFDLRHAWVGYRVCPIHQLNIYLPRNAIAAISDAEGANPVEDFAHDPCQGTSDSTALNLARTLLPTFAQPDEVSPLFVEAVTSALAAHVVHTYGLRRPPRGHAPSISRAALGLARDMIEAGASLGPLARECGSSVDALNRAFHESIGRSPTRWLLERRVAKAQVLLRKSSIPLGDVAAHAGFASEGHMERVFRRLVGTTPAACRAVTWH
jgi:AraC family transcriptional regulator